MNQLAYKIVKKINSKLNYLFRKNHFLITRHILCNALIQRHFDYACIGWYPDLCKKLENKIQTTKNKCVWFWLNLDDGSYITKWVRKLNWLPISDRINQCILSSTFKFDNDIGPNYLNEVFQWAAECNRTLRNKYLKLKHPFHQTTSGQNSLCFLGSSKWNKLPESTKKCNNINTFKLNLKKLAQLSN